MPPRLKRPTYYKKKTEENLQVRVCNYLRKNHPDIIFCSDYAAGLKLTDWQRIQMMKMRSHDGQPDISIDHPSRGFFGLRIELKSEGTKIYKKDGVTLRKQPYVRRYKNGTVKRGDHLAEQAETLKKYNDIGYFARFGIGYNDTIKLIRWYLDLPEQTSLF